MEELKEMLVVPGNLDAREKSVILRRCYCVYSGSTKTDNIALSGIIMHHCCIFCSRIYTYYRSRAPALLVKILSFSFNLSLEISSEENGRFNIVKYSLSKHRITSSLLSIEKRKKSTRPAAN